MLPEPINSIIRQELKRAEEDTTIQLVRRKGDQEEQLEEIYTGMRVSRDSAAGTKAAGAGFDLLPDGEAKTTLLEFWMKFHAGFAYPNFSVFYSKRKFCAYFFRFGKNTVQMPADAEERFISLLADRKFLFLEDNEHGNNPAYQPMSEIIRNPKRYSAPAKMPRAPDVGQEANQKMLENAKLVLEQGFVPTYAHRRAYLELKCNEEEIKTALEQRKEFIQRSTHFFQDGSLQFPTFTISDLQSEKSPTAIDEELSQLFHDFLFAAMHKAYVKKKYEELIDSAKENSLRVITSVNKYLEENQDILVCKALVFWRLFTQETRKLANGELKEFKFRMSKVETGRQLTRQTQAPSSRKIECQIMLFDYLLKILPPEEGEQETAYAKFQFHAFTKYNGYTHFRVNDITNLKYNSDSECKFDFNLIPDSKDSVDSLGGVIRRHILRCIPNDVRWLTPGLPNNWNISSGILATLLLQDISRFPKINRLTTRINNFLNDRGRECVQSYVNFDGGQSELIALLESWCSENGLIFEEDIPSSDMEISDDQMKMLCSRLVLEYMLKDRALQEVREDLAAAAQNLWGELLLRGIETFYPEEDT